MGDCNCQKGCQVSATNTGRQEQSEAKAYTRSALSFIMLVVGMSLSAADVSWFDNQWICFAWYLLAYIPVGAPVVAEAWKTLREKDVFSEYLLMTIATFGAFFIGEYPEGVAVMLFYSVGELFQSSAVSRAKKNISALLDIRPQTATVVTGDQLETVAPDTVEVGSIVEVKTGERVPLDGTLLTEWASFNTSALTGESVPRIIRRGEEVLTGMISADTTVRLTVTKPFGQSALSRILELVQHATERKAPTEQFIRKFARIYTPIVVALATLIVLLPFIYSLIVTDFNYQFYNWVQRGLVFLVISCPCALVVSIPLGYFGGIGCASRQGILFKGSNYLDAITKVNTVVMDKTGTLTQGVFEVQKIVSNGTMSTEELLRTVASVETQSNHPIAKAIVTYSNERQMILGKPENVKEKAGLGLEAVLAGNDVSVGNARLMNNIEVGFPSEVPAIPETFVMCAVNFRYEGYIIVADALKEDAARAISSLREVGIKKTVMLSGDKQAIVSKLASELGIDEAHGDLLPEGKVEHTERLKAIPGNNIAFVGDGINDAPVLAMSDIGIAMGGLGSDVAIETADVIIQTDQPSKIAAAIKIGKATRRIVYQNIGLAFGIKLLVLILGGFGMATLWEAVFADVGVSLLAIFNSVRILRMKF